MKVEFSAFPRAFTGNVAMFVAADKQLLATAQAMDKAAGGALSRALGAGRFVDTNNVAGVPGSANPFLQNYYKDKGTSEYDAIFSHFDLDSDELIEAPQALVSP